MSVAALAPTQKVSTPILSIYRFSVDQYHRMIEAGILTDEDRVELFEGLIIDKMPHNPPHDGTVASISRRLMRMLPDDWLVRVQLAITLAESELEPDLAIVTGPEATYYKRHPMPRDIGQLIEVSDTSLARDRGSKGLLYAQARIPVYWIINIAQAKVEVYTQPKGGKVPHYHQRRDYVRGEEVPLILAGADLSSITVDNLLPVR